MYRKGYFNSILYGFCGSGCWEQKSTRCLSWVQCYAVRGTDRLPPVAGRRKAVPT